MGHTKEFGHSCVPVICGFCGGVMGVATKEKTIDVRDDDWKMFC